MQWLKRILPSFLPAPWDIWAWWVAYSPVLIGVATALTGYMEGLSWMWIMMAGSLSFAGTAVGLVNLTSWRQNRRVEDKLAFESVFVGRQPQTGEISIGFRLRSSADFPLKCRVEEISTSIGDRIPRERADLPKTYDVPPQGVFYYHDHFIKLDPDTNGTMQGSIKSVVSYGRGDNLQYKFYVTRTIFMGFDKGVLKGFNSIES